MDITSGVAPCASKTMFMLAISLWHMWILVENDVVVRVVWVVYNVSNVG